MHRTSHEPLAPPPHAAHAAPPPASYALETLGLACLWVETRRVDANAMLVIWNPRERRTSPNQGRLRTACGDVHRLRRCGCCTCSKAQRPRQLRWRRHGWTRTWPSVHTRLPRPSHTRRRCPLWWRRRSSCAIEYAPRHRAPLTPTCICWRSPASHGEFDAFDRTHAARACTSHELPTSCGRGFLQQGAGRAA